MKRFEVIAWTVMAIMLIVVDVVVLAIDAPSTIGVECLIGTFGFLGAFCLIFLRRFSNSGDGWQIIG